MERARSMSPSVNISAANLWYVYRITHRIELENTPQDGVSIDTRMLKIDSGCTIRAYDDLELRVVSSCSFYLMKCLPYHTTG